MEEFKSKIRAMELTIPDFLLPPDQIDPEAEVPEIYQQRQK